MSGRFPVGLRIYRLLSAAEARFAPILLVRRAKRGKEHRQRLPETRGESRIARPEFGCMGRVEESLLACYR